MRSQLEMVTRLENTQFLPAMPYVGFRYVAGMPTFPKPWIPVFGHVYLQVSHMTHRLERLNTVDSYSRPALEKGRL